jgi:hypothetical protein
VWSTAHTISFSSIQDDRRKYKKNSIQNTNSTRNTNQRQICFGLCTIRPEALVHRADLHQELDVRVVQGFDLRTMQTWKFGRPVRLTVFDGQRRESRDKPHPYLFFGVMRMIYPRSGFKLSVMVMIVVATCNNYINIYF